MKFCILVVTLVVSAYSAPMSNQAKKALANKVLKEVFVENQEQMKDYIRQLVKDTIQANSKKSYMTDDLENIFKTETEKPVDENKDTEPGLEKDISSQEKELLGNENESGTDKEVLENESSAQNFKNVNQIAKLLENVPKQLVDQYYKEKADHKKNILVNLREMAKEPSVFKNVAKKEESEKQEFAKKEDSASNKFEKNLEKALDANRSTKDSKNGETKKYSNTKKEAELVNDPTLLLSEGSPDIHLESIADGDEEVNETKVDSDKSENRFSGEEDTELETNPLLKEYLKKELKEKLQMLLVLLKLLFEIDTKSFSTN